MCYVNIGYQLGWLIGIGIFLIAASLWWQGLLGRWATEDAILIGEALRQGKDPVEVVRKSR